MANGFEGYESCRTVLRLQLSSQIAHLPIRIFSCLHVTCELQLQPAGTG